MRALTVVTLAGLLAASTAHAEPAGPVPWYHGPHGTNRVVHLAITVGGGLAYIASESFLKSSLAPGACRWCQPPSLDTTMRDTLIWSSPGTAAGLSNVTGFVAAPVFGIGMTLAGVLTSDSPNLERVIDDTIPVLESVVIAELATQVVKFSVGRERPFVHFGAPAPHQLDDDLSFFSGHSALAFSLATSAGVIAHRRHAWTEPYIWGGGMAIATFTAYLRVAGDRHYFTDVAAGSAVGVLAGLTVPLLMPRGDVEVLPTGRGVAIAGRF